MNKSDNISFEDVAKVASDLKIKVNDSQIENIVKEYPDRINDLDTWDIIVEDMLYELKR